MADATQTSEVIARSFTPEAGAPGAPPLTPEQQKNQEAANALRQRLAAKPEDPLAALMPSEEERRIPADIDAQLERRFGEGGVIAPGSDSENRLEEARTAGGIAIRVAEGEDFATFTPDEQTEISHTFEDVLNRRPAFQRLPDEVKAAIALEIIKNPNYREKVGELLSARLSPEEVIEAEGRVVEARATHETAETELTAKVNEMYDMADELRRVEDELDEFNETTSFGGRGLRFDELDDLARNETDDIDAISILRQELINDGLSDDQINKLEEEVSGKIDRKEPITDPSELWAQEILECRQRLAKLEAIRNEQKRLADEGDRLNDRLSDMPVEIGVLTNTRNEAETNLRSEEGQKAGQEEEVVEGVRRVVAQAANEFLSAEAKSRYEEYQSQLNKEIEAAKDSDEKKLLERFKTRWDRAERRGDNIRFTINRRVVNNDMSELLVGGGPEAIVREMLMEGLEERPTDTPEERARKVQERERIEKRLSEDKEFAGKWKAKLAAEVVTHKLQYGRLYEGEIRVMLDRDWGETAIDEAIAKDKKKADMIDKVFGRTGEPGVVGRIKRAGGRNWLYLLMLVLTGGMAASFVTSKLASPEGGRQ